MAITEVLPDFSAVSPAQCCQAFFVSASAFVAGLFVLPEAARRTLMDYGARRPKDGASEETAARESALTRFLAVLTSYGQVPHSWFLHYYIVSVSWSAFWAWQYLTHGSVMAAMAQRQDRAGESSLDLGSVFVAWALLALQGGRRLYETLYVSKPSNSTMWFAHWVLGLLYYTSNGISVWIEGSGEYRRARHIGLCGITNIFQVPSSHLGSHPSQSLSSRRGSCLDWRCTSLPATSRTSAIDT